MNKIMCKALLVFALFLSGCSWDFKAVESDYRGVFDKPPANPELPPERTAVIEGDLVTISRNDDSPASRFHVSSAVSHRNTADGAYTYVLYNGMERIGYFNRGERDVFYIDDSRQDYFIRRGSNVTVGPEEPENPENPYYY
jgi:hypothetical protein